MPKAKAQSRKPSEAKLPALAKGGQSAHSKLLARDLPEAYRLMHRRLGHLGWWPGETPLEVCVGAILTQNTSWSNVERAINNLKSAGVMEVARLHALPEAELARLVRPAGYFNVKARRLKAFLSVLVEDFAGNLSRMLEGPTGEVRERLLSISGIGPETADSILLYASDHLSFVVDNYTRRIFSRHGWCVDGIPYEGLKEVCESALGDGLASDRGNYWKDYHAQLVMVGKEFCRKRQPRCQVCPLKSLLPSNPPSGH